MKIQRVEFRNFLSFTSFDLDLDGHSAWILGENAGGTTSRPTGIARALTFTSADFADLQQPIERDPVAEEAEVGNVDTPQAHSRSRREERGAIPLSQRPSGRPHAAEAFFARTVVLVEGISDQLALEALAERRGRSLEAEHISIVPIGGASNIGHFLDLFGPHGFDVRLAGLCDVAEEADFQRGLERAGFGSNLTGADMERLGFYVCIADLEDELIRSLGAASVERIIDAQGDLGSFRTLQKQPAWRGRTNEEQLRRFMGSGGRRKIRYARLLVDALDLTQVPRPLDRVLAHV